MIGIVPAAGYATRLGPLPGSKELLDVGGFPVVECLVRRLEAGGCGEIRIVTRPDKTDVREYAERRGLRVLLGRPPHVGASVAVALDGVAPGELVALGYPDTLWEPLEGFTLLRRELDESVDVVLGLFESVDASRSDVVELDERGRVVDILVKPAKPPSTLIWGCLVARAGALSGIGAFPEVSDALRHAIADRRVGSRRLSERWLDIGVPAALDQAREAKFSVLSS
jgi:glucose-1-phosphate thymidylyltransferase